MKIDYNKLSNKLVRNAADQLQNFPKLYEIWQKQGWEIAPITTEKGIAVLINPENDFLPNDDRPDFLRRSIISGDEFWDIDVANGWYHC